MNRIELVGRLTADPVERNTKDGKTVLSFRIAVRKWTQGQDNADFFNCAAFGKTAENMKKFNFAKGNGVIIFGQIHNNSYTGRDGQRRDDWQVFVEEFEPMGGNQRSDGFTPTSEPAPKFEQVDEDLQSELDLPF